MLGEKMLWRQMNRSSLKGLGRGESAFQHLWALALCCPLVLSGPPTRLFPVTLRCPRSMDHLSSSVSRHPHPGGGHRENAQRHRFPCRKKQVCRGRRKSHSVSKLKIFITFCGRQNAKNGGILALIPRTYEHEISLPWLCCVIHSTVDVRGRWSRWAWPDHMGP